MTARAWLAGACLLTLALLVHAAFPRYTWQALSGQPTALVRLDRWTGRAQWGVLDRTTGRWRPLPPLVTNADVDKVLSDIDHALATSK